jgi:membrane-bound lytic murein transglycosylase D
MGGYLLRRKILMFRLCFFSALALLTGLSLCPLGAESTEGLRPESATPDITEGDRSEGTEIPVLPRPLRQVRTNLPARFRQARIGALPENTSFSAISGLDNPLTQRYIRQYSSPGGITWLKAVMERGEPYLAFIRREVSERNLPEELIYLPVIESAYVPTAVSRSGAVGLWQFMRNSIGGYGMQVTDWADERMDFWKSTQGALQKLEDNYKQLGDWPLALAAYNAGLGGVNRIINQTGIKDYWILAEKKYFKTETIHYIPKLLAVSYVLSHPRQFGFPSPWSADPQWTRILLDRPVDLNLLAEHAGIDGDLLRMGNPELRYSITPPEQGYQLKVRSADAAAVIAVLEQNELPLIRHYFHTLSYGDTLSALAQHYHVTVDQIIAANPGTNPKYLQIGKRLRIPALTDAGPYRRKNASAGTDFTGQHVVKKGETLWSIALGYDVDPEVLAAANGMGLNDTLREGRILKTPIMNY